MSIFGKNIDEKEANAPSPYLNLEEDILKRKLQILSVEIVTARDPRFGANEKDGLLKKDILQEGETFKYSFLTEEGQEKIYETKSTAFYVGIREANLQGGEWVKISRKGKMEETRYKFEVVK